MGKKFKNLILTALATVTMFSVIGISSQQVQAKEPIKVIVNGKYVVFDEQPIIENGSTFVPMRAIFEALGFEVRWDNQFQLVLADMIEDYYLISVRLYGSDKMDVGYTEYTKADTYITNHTTNRNSKDFATNFTNKLTLNPPYKSINGRILVPVRAIAEGSGATVKWDNETQTVIIDSSNKIITNIETGEEFVVSDAKTRVDNYFNREVSNQEITNTTDNNAETNTSNDNTETNEEMTREEKELEIVRLVNIERVNVGLNEVEIADDLMYVARWHADEMAELDYFEHLSPTLNLQHTALANHFGGDYSYAGENIYGGASLPNGIISAWMNSEGHRKHILNPKVKYIGVGYTFDNNKNTAKCSLFMGY